MSDMQSIIDRQLGIYFRFNYDNVLRRLVVSNGESFYGLQNSNVTANLEEDPPIFACRFAEAAGYEHILALANEDGRVALQNTVGGSVEGFQCHNNAVFDLAWMPNTMKFVTVSGDHTAHLWTAEEAGPKREQIFSAHTRSVKTLAFRPLTPWVFATGARDGDVLLWDTRVPPCPVTMLARCHSGPRPGRRGEARATSITGLVFQSDDTLISCGECDGNIKVWDLRRNYDVYKREPLPRRSIPYCGSSAKNGYTNLITDRANTKLYASCMDNVIYCFNISTYNTLPEQRYIGHENNTFYIKTCLSPDNQYLVSGSSDKNAYIWNLKCSEPVVKLTGHWAEVTCPAWCQLGDTKIVTCSDDARHKIWRIGKEFYDGEELQGKAEVVPRIELATLPQWGAIKSPHSIKRKMGTPTSGAKRSRLDSGSIKKSKRCLTDMMNAAKEDELNAKRIKLDPIRSESELKRSSEDMDVFPSPSKRLCPNNKENSTWTYSPKAGTSFMTPTKNFERKTPKKMSPKLDLSPVKTVKIVSFTSPTTDVTSVTSTNGESAHTRFGDEQSPTRAKVFNTPTKYLLNSPIKLDFGSPTMNLPNFVLSGQAPHLRLMSPGKKKPESRNWLTELSHKKPTPAVKDPCPNKKHPPTPPRISNQRNTLLKYFNKDH